MPRTLTHRGAPTGARAEPARQGEKQDGMPTPPMALPHERDQAADQTRPRTDPVIKRAHDDLAAGQMDTDLRGTPGLDAERRKRLVPGGR